MPKPDAVVSGVMNNAYGQTLDTPIKYSQTYEELVDGDAIPADEQLSAKEILDVVNTRRRNAARQKGMNAALDAAGIVKPTLADVKVQFSTMVKVLLAANKPQAEAEDIARTALGLTANPS